MKENNKCLKDCLMKEEYKKSLTTSINLGKIWLSVYVRFNDYVFGRYCSQFVLIR